jgi:hypothetical protein
MSAPPRPRSNVAGRAGSHARHLHAQRPRGNIQALPSRRPAAARYSTYERRQPFSLAPLAIGTLLSAILLVGWLRSDDGHLTPQNGIGYALGILGASMLLLLLIYPLRKRVKALRGIGSVGGWFRIHMTLGLIGPALILFHSNFKLGSLNSNVALLSMLTVAGSGLVGRYLYRRIHLKFYGQKTEVRDILADVEGLKHAIEGGLPLSESLHNKLDAYATAALADRRGALGWLATVAGLRFRSLRLRSRLKAEVVRVLAAEKNRQGWTRRATRKRATEINGLLLLYFSAVNKAATFAFYERLFSLWHLLHLPLFILLILTAVAHVIAVHLY